MIKARGVSVSIGGRTILENESVHCKTGMMTALVGPSGCGKTTLLNSLGLLLPIDQGGMLINGEDVTRYSAAARRRFWRDFAAFVLQDYGIMDEETIAFNVTMETSLFGRRVTGNEKQLAQALKKVGLQGRENELASHLSGGEKQRLSLARAIYKDARILYVDEPTASLDTVNRHKVIELFSDFAVQGRTVIVSTHDIEMINACGAKYEVGSKNPENNEIHTNQENFGGL